MDRHTVFLIHEDCFELNVSRSAKHVIRMTVCLWFKYAKHDLVFFDEKKEIRSIKINLYKNSPTDTETYLKQK